MDAARDLASGARDLAASAWQTPLGAVPTTAYRGLAMDSGRVGDSRGVSVGASGASPRRRRRRGKRATAAQGKASSGESRVRESRDSCLLGDGGAGGGD